MGQPDIHKCSAIKKFVRYNNADLPMDSSQDFSQSNGMAEQGTIQIAGFQVIFLLILLTPFLLDFFCKCTFVKQFCFPISPIHPKCC